MADDMARPAVTVAVNDLLLTTIRKTNRTDTTELIVVDPKSEARGGSDGGGASPVSPMRRPVRHSLSEDGYPAKGGRPIATLSGSCVTRTIAEALLSGQQQQQLPAFWPRRLPGKGRRMRYASRGMDGRMPREVLADDPMEEKSTSPQAA